MTLAKQKAELKKMIEIRNAATPGEWEARCNEFSNSARPRFIWDSTWGFIAECNSGSQDVVNAEFIALAGNEFAKIAEQFVEALEVIEFYAAKDVSFMGGMEIKDEYDGEMGDRARAYLAKVSKENGK